VENLGSSTVYFHQKYLLRFWNLPNPCFCSKSTGQQEDASFTSDCVWEDMDGFKDHEGEDEDEEEEDKSFADAEEEVIFILAGAALQLILVIFFVFSKTII